MNELLCILWIVAKGVFLVAGIGAILAGGICGAFLAPGAMGHDALAKDFFVIAIIVFVVGLIMAIPAWRSLRRDRRAAKARLEAELEAIRQRGRAPAGEDGPHG